MSQNDEIRRRDLETIQRVQETAQKKIDRLTKDNKRLLDEKGCHGEACRARFLAKIDSLEALCKRWKNAIEGLTPGGSEYADDPERCAEHIRSRVQYPKIIIDLKQKIEKMKCCGNCVEHTWAEYRCNLEACYNCKKWRGEG